MKIIIAGASGLVGTALTKAARADGHMVEHLVRPGGKAGGIRWDPQAGTLDAEAMEGADAVVNLSGASIADGRWTAERKVVLRESRIHSTRVLVNAIARLGARPRVFISAAAIGIYGDRGNQILTEASEPGSGFLAQLGRDWEMEAGRAEKMGVRTAMLRFGVIMAANGGALPRMLLPFRAGLGGKIGSGRQWMSWIALEDALRIIRACLDDEGLRGPLNAVAQNPVTNAEFARIAGRVLHRPALLRVPAAAMQLALGEMADALLLSSQRVVPERLIEAGFRFRYRALEPFLEEILARGQ